MPRIARQTLLARFRAKIAAGRPLIGGGAGTGLSAKCEEAGGIDLIVIYNSGRYRMAGRGSLAGLLAYGNANEIVCEMAHEVLPVVKDTPVLAGVNGTDPFMIADEFLQRLIALGFSGVQNFPTVGLIDGTFRANLEETGMGYGLEVELIARAHALDLLTTPYVFSEADATGDGRGRRRHRRLPPRPHDRRRDRRADGADPGRLRSAHRGARRRREGGAQRRDRALPRRPDRDARRRRLHPRPLPVVPRLLRRELDGAPARRDRAHRDDAALHPDLRRQTMTGSQFGSFILGLVVVAIVVAIAVWLLHWLYLRSSKERSFVRTGLGGQKVVLDGGAFVLPIVHDVIPVNMNTLRLEVTRGRDKALITRDRMRVDLIAEFYVRVAARPDAVAAAAQTLGQRTMEPEQLKELVEGKFVDALRTAAAEMTMEELHEKRGAYVKRVRETVAEDLTKNGLELESVSLTQLDQTGMEYFNPSNAFDAEGLTRLTETIEQRKKQRNDVEQDTLIAIRNKNLEAEKLSLEIDREGEYARLTQQREVEIARARQRAELMTERAQREEQGESAQIAAKQTIDAARIRSEQTIEQERIGKERTIQAAEIDRRMTVELAEQKRAIAVAKESEAQSVAQAAADTARADAVTAEEKVFTAREVEMAERKKAIELIGSRQVAEREALRLTSAARAEKDASADRGAAVRAQAEADADADKIKSMAMRVRAEIEAEALRMMNDAHNMLSPEARMSALRMRLVEKAEGIIRESVRPMERIEGIKILHVDGLGGSSHGANGDAGHGGGGFSDGLVNSALRFRAQAPLVDQLLREIGIEGGDIQRLVGGVSGAQVALPPGPPKD